MQVSAQTDQATQTSSPRPRLHPRFHSRRFLPNDRDVTVYLPPGYEENGDRSYPVLYMNDGQNLFGSATSFAKGLRAKGWRPGTDLRYERIPGGTHDEAAWSQRVRPMLRFLFPA